MTTVIAHGDVLRNRAWAIEEVHRVLDKLATEHATLRLDPGFPLDLAESLAHRPHDLTVVPAQANWLPMWAAYERHHQRRRLEHLLTDGGSVQVRFLAVDDPPRVSFTKRDEVLALDGGTHVVVYDGRDRGSVLRYLQHVHGIRPLVLIDPIARTVRVKHAEEAPCTSAPTTTSIVPSIG